MTPSSLSSLFIYAFGSFIFLLSLIRSALSSNVSLDKSSSSSKESSSTLEATAYFSAIRISRSRSSCVFLFLIARLYLADSSIKVLCSNSYNVFKEFASDLPRYARSAYLLGSWWDKVSKYSSRWSIILHIKSFVAGKAPDNIAPIFSSFSCECFTWTLVESNLHTLSSFWLWIMYTFSMNSLIRFSGMCWRRSSRVRLGDVSMLYSSFCWILDMWMKSFKFKWWLIGDLDATGAFSPRFAAVLSLMWRPWERLSIPFCKSIPSFRLLSTAWLFAIAIWLKNAVCTAWRRARCIRLASACFSTGSSESPSPYWRVFRAPFSSMMASIP